MRSLQEIQWIIRMKAPQLKKVIEIIVIINNHGKPIALGFPSPNHELNVDEGVGFIQSFLRFTLEERAKM